MKTKPLLIVLLVFAAIAYVVCLVLFIRYVLFPAVCLFVMAVLYVLAAITMTW